MIRRKGLATLIVLDTNVLVSALLTHGGIPARVLDLVLTRQIRVAYDQRILEEYQKVLTRPHFPIEPYGILVLSPAAFLEQFQK